jgi:hypothetical protein
MMMMSLVEIYDDGIVDNLGPPSIEETLPKNL